MEHTEETKVWSTQLVCILLYYGSETNIIYGLTFFFFAPSEQVSLSIGGIMMAVARWGFNWQEHAQGVRGDTSKSFSLRLHSFHIPRSLFQLTGFHFFLHAFYAARKIGEKHTFLPQFSPFPLMMVDKLTFSLKWQTKGIYPHFAWQPLTESSFAFILLLLAKDRLRSSLSVSKSWN